MRHGATGRGVAERDKARQYEAAFLSGVPPLLWCRLRGEATPGQARHPPVWLCLARHGNARRALAWLTVGIHVPTVSSYMLTGRGKTGQDIPGLG